jgi:hypothetical protein
MIYIVFGLGCSNCKEAFGGPNYATEFLPQASIDLLRKAAHDNGWRRVRITAIAGTGDYCPKCIEAIKAARKDRGATSAITGKPRRRMSNKLPGAK